MYRYNMSGEQEKKSLIPAGWRIFDILKCEEQTSKQGNPMFKFTIVDAETTQEEEIYAIAVQGKRWFLKSILNACNIAAGQDGIYEWDIPDVEGKTIKGLVVHYEEEWINRENRKIKTPRWKITTVEEFKEEEHEDGADKPETQEEPAPF